MSTCKKYPENTLWFKSVEKINFFSFAGITEYRVNGADSLNSFSKYFGSKVKSKVLTSLQFMDDRLNNNGVYNTLYTTNDGYQIHFGYSYSKNKKRLILYSNSNRIDTSIIKKNIFVEYLLWWDIVKLNPDGERKIRTNYNGNIYEITFNKIY